MPNIVIVTPGPVSQEWEMICPGCRRDNRIHIQGDRYGSFSPVAVPKKSIPTPNGTDASIAQCRHCDHTGTVRDFCDAFSSLRSGDR